MRRDTPEHKLELVELVPYFILTCDPPTPLPFFFFFLFSFLLLLDSLCSLRRF